MIRTRRAYEAVADHDGETMRREPCAAYRSARDTLGEVQVPADALYGAQTQRAVDNSPLSGMRLPTPFIHALGLIKHAAAQVNVELGLWAEAPAQAIAQAADEVARGMHDAHFPIDVFQTGSGTSTNMNANEVIARRAMQIRGEKTGEAPIHPNDDVNLGQSSNDVMPTAIHVSAHLVVSQSLLPALRHLTTTIRTRAAEHAQTLKTGRTLRRLSGTAGAVGDWRHGRGDGPQYASRVRAAYGHEARGHDWVQLC